MLVILMVIIQVKDLTV